MKKRQLIDTNAKTEMLELFEKDFKAVFIKITQQEILYTQKI